MTERIDWAAVREQLARGEAALERALVPDAARIDAVLRARAERFRDRSDTAAAVVGEPVLVFRAGGRRYALGLEALAGVQPFAGCAAVPGTPAHLLGAVSIRGEIAAVVALRRLLGEANGGEAAEAPGYLLVLRAPEALLALCVDEIEGIAAIDPASLSDLERTRFVRGLTSDLIALLDVEALLREV